MNCLKAPGRQPGPCNSGYGGTRTDPEFPKDTLTTQQYTDMANLTTLAGQLMSNMTNPLPNNQTGNSSLEVTTYKVTDVLYLSEDERLKNYLEWKISWYLDVVYAPICSILGILGNTLCFIVLLSHSMRSTTSYLYMAVLSCTDTIVLVLNILFMVTKFPGQEIFRRGTCGLIFFLMYFSIHYNVLLMCTMTIERYIAIKFPLRAPKWISIKKARVLILVEFFVALALDFHSFFTREMVPDPDTGEEHCTTLGETNTFFVRKVWPWVDAVIYCYGPLSCLLIVNILLITEVKKAGKKQRQMTQESVQVKTAAESRSRGRQVTVMLLSVSFTFLIFVTPMAVIIVVERYFWFQSNAHEQAVYHLVRTICNNMMYTNHALNFVLYCLAGKRFRDQFKNIFFFCSRESNKTRFNQNINNYRHNQPAIEPADKPDLMKNVNKSLPMSSADKSDSMQSVTTSTADTNISAISSGDLSLN